MSDPARSGHGPAESCFERMRAVADAVLYEGYLLYPYRRSSPKNRVRWQFGVLAPRGWAEANCPETADTTGVTGAADSWRQRTECLLEAVGDDAVVHVRVRWLQLQHKAVERRDGDGRYVPVESLETAGAVHLTFDEAVPRQTDAVVPLAELLAGERTFALHAPGGEDVEALAEDAGRLVRGRRPAAATATLSAVRLSTEAGAEAAGTEAAGTAGPGTYRLRVRVENTARTLPPDAPREEALGYALLATHTFLGGRGVEFLSLVDPPAWAGPYVRGCRNLHTFPVLAGKAGDADADPNAGDADGRETMLSAPIILPDHPQVAPESPGDLHDAAEIDEILSLRTLLLTDEEKREARATDERAAQILDRVDGMPPEVFSRLHGAIRSMRPASPPQAQQPPPARDVWWEEGADDGLSPATDSVPVDGVAVARGSRVRLHPSARGADAQDIFLAGRTAEVAAVFHDVDGSLHVAVTLDDDPAAELHRWYGRFRYFRPYEIQPLDPAAAPDAGREESEEREDRTDGPLRPTP